MPLLKTLIDDGENSWDSEQGANVVCSADASVYKVGTKSAKMAISAGLGAVLLATQDIVAGATDYSSCSKVRVWIRSSVDVDAGDLQLLLDATADCPTPEETLDIPALTADTWAIIDIALANPASDGAIVSVGLKQTEELGALDVYIDDCNGCQVFPEYQQRVALGFYAAGGKFVPIKVDANGEISIIATVADIVTAYITHWGGTALTGRNISSDIQKLTDGIAIGERVISKTIRDIAPGDVDTFCLPETGNIDLSKYLASSWGIYAPTTDTMVINCYLNISHDGGTTWRRAAGYEILDADFVRDAWNTIDCPLKLAEAKLEVVITVAPPAELDLMCIAKP